MNEPVQRQLSDKTAALQVQYPSMASLMQAWDAAAKQLAAAKYDEMALRLAVFELQFPQPSEGVNRVELGGGWHLKADYKYNYNLANKEQETEKALEQIAQTGNEGAFIADRLVNWRPELSLTEYRKLPDQYKVLLGPALTIKPAAPSLEFEAPKAT